MQIEKENINAYINYNYKPIKKSLVVSELFNVWILMGLFYLCNLSIFLLFIGNILFTFFSIITCVNKEISLKQQELYSGISSIYLMLFLTYIMYILLPKNGNDNYLLLWGTIILTIITNIFYNLVILHFVKMGRYINKVYRLNYKFWVSFIIIGIFCFIIAELLRETRPETVGNLAYSILFVYFVLGVIPQNDFLLKYFLIKKLEKLESEQDIKI